MTHNKSIRQEVIELETYKSNYIQKNYVEGKVIIITGASSGFGKLTAKRAAEMGGKIVLAARSEEKLKETVAEIKAAGGEASYIAGAGQMGTVHRHQHQGHYFRHLRRL